MMGRRQFMSTVGVLGMGLLFAKNVPASRHPAAVQRIDYFPYLLAVLEEQAPRWGGDVLPEQRECLAYTCENIRPATHAELAVVVALGEGFLENRKLVVDEYVQRRSGMTPMLDDHPLLELTNWGAPSTYRVMLFKEQFIMLIDELTDEGRKKSRERLSTYLKRKDIVPLREIAKPEYQELLNEDEFSTLERIIRSHAGYAKPYCYCSTIAARAENLARADV